MFSKPFKPPLLRKSTANPNPPSNITVEDHPAKRRRISDDDVSKDNFISDIPQKSKSKQCEVHSRRPLEVLRNPPSPEQAQRKDDNREGEGYYMVLWRKFTNKKNKTWDSDGILAVRSGYAVLQDLSGSDLGRTKFSSPLLPGSILSVGGKEIEVQDMISKQDYLAGKPFLATKKAPHVSKSTSTTTEHVAPRSQLTGIVTPQIPQLSLQARMKAEMQKEKDAAKTPLTSAPLNTKATKTSFRNPIKATASISRAPTERPTPMFDPYKPGALVFQRPKTAPKGRQIVDVVLDPRLSNLLRPHQREGVKFLYECVMGLRDFNGQGCILADDMGLGKTLQTIALLWTLLKQNPIHKAEPVIKKAMIVCPVSLINNWRKEFRKWLGNDRIGVFVVDGPKTKLTDFTMGRIYNVMIIGYERLKGVAEELTKGSGIDIVIADEGHRLKTEKNKSAKAIQSLNAAKRIILSGTPIQNDLSEFFSMINFVNDGCLGTYKSFLKSFETPIVRSRQPDALENDIEVGEARSEELAQLTSPFILRRTADILSKYLPPKTEYVLFCDPTPEQSNIYRHVLATPMFSSALGNTDTALQLITILKKLCNSPSLLSSKTDEEDGSSSNSLTTLIDMLPTDVVKTFRNRASTKIRVLDQLLHEIRSTTDEKVVLVSNYTSTLNILAQLLTANGLPHSRLDGSTPAGKRQALVDDFNRSSAKNCFAFLLSAKAGGLGLNLIGGSRLILFDVDWNPATDDQAMARIHREGQKRHCKIYRFLVKGALEERIWQRQVVKRGLADSIMDGGSITAKGAGGGKKGVAAFSRDELKDLFRLDESEVLRTHELIGCPCGGKGTTASDERVVKEQSRNRENSGDGSEGAETDDESIPDLTTLVKASALTSAMVEEQELKIAAGRHPKQANAVRKQQEEMEALMEYAHIDAAVFSGLDEASDEFHRAEEAVDDDCLMQVLRQDRDSVAGGVSYLFKKASISKASQPGVIEVKREEIKSSFFKGSSP